MSMTLSELREHLRCEQNRGTGEFVNIVYISRDHWLEPDFPYHLKEWCVMQNWKYLQDWVRDSVQDFDRQVAFRFRTRDQAAWFQLRWS
jgi:hypothetical protein